MHIMRTLGLRDIIGPIMVGPSSSHTAGALAIARMARRLCGSAPRRVTFTLYGSFAHTGRGHGTDKALVAGMLGLAADDLAIRNSFELAERAGIDVALTFDTKTAQEHPNTVDVTIEEQDGTTLDVRGVSIGGGAAVITRIDGIDVDITGEHTSIVVHQQDECGVLAHIASCLATCGINIATTRMFRTRRGADAFTVMETDDAIAAQVRALIEDHPSVHSVRIIPAAAAQGGADAETDEARAADATGAASEPAQDDASGARLDAAAAERELARWDFISGSELLTRCAQERASIAQTFRRREEALAALNGSDAAIDAYLDRVLDVMRDAAHAPLDHGTPSIGGLIGGEAHAIIASTEAGVPTLLDPLGITATAFALATLETNASMGRIVATPTAGSAGVVPAVLLALEERRGFTQEQLREGLLTAAAVGYLVARNASVSGAEGGCQAEVGTACAMAAAAAVEMCSGTPEQALSAASNALTSLMGLVCDPVGGLVEVPCQKRNATAAITSLVSAQIAFAGIENLVDFDETVAAMDAVGRALPFELRESALGGIAAAPSACAFCTGCA